MTSIGGIEGLHSVQGLCDLCGEDCDTENQELNALSCTFAPNCPPESSLYHQECLERYLKNIRCEKNRKTGFKCPRGCGKGTRYDEPCRGKIDKSHPIHVRNDNNKKRKKAKMPEPQPDAVPRFGPAAKAARAKEREQEQAKLKAQQKADSAAKKAAATAPLPKAKAAAAKKDSLASAAAAARWELGLTNGAGKAAAKPATPPPVIRSYEDHVAARNAKMPVRPAQPAPTQSVWGAASSTGAVLAKRPPAAPARTPSPPAVSSTDAFPAVSVANKLAMPIPNGRWAGGSAVLSGASSSASIASSGGLAHATSGSAQPAASPAAATTLPAASASSQEVPKLSKALRKNMRRAERKREKEAEMSVVSEPSPPATPHQTPGLGAARSPLSSPARSAQAAAEPAVASGSTTAQPLPQLSLDGDILDHCLQLVATHKVQQASVQLRRLGFPQWQAAGAVQLAGCALHPAVQWLLEGHVSSESEAQQLLLRTAPPAVDVTEEAAQLTAAAEALAVSQARVCQEVARHNGDVAAALAALGRPASSSSSSSGGTSGGVRQRHQRTFSPLQASPQKASHSRTASLSQPSPPPQQVQQQPQQQASPLQPQRQTQLQHRSRAGSRSDALDPLLDAVLPREVVGAGGRSHLQAAAPGSSGVIGSNSAIGGGSSGIGFGSGGTVSQPGRLSGGFGGALSPFPLSPGGGIGCAGDSAAHSRVSSFDMLSVGNPWGDLQPVSSERHLDHQSAAHKLQQPDGGTGAAFQQLPTPFGATGLPQLLDMSPTISRASQQGQQPQLSLPSFYGSPASFGAPLPSSAGLDQYASAMSSQPSWASTSSNLWGAPGGLPDTLGRGTGSMNGTGGSAQQLTDAVPAAALLAAAAVASEAEADASGGGSGGGMSLGENELSALMATLMAR